MKRVNVIPYVGAWNISPNKKDLIIQAVVKNQKMNLLISYWEGAVVVLDKSGNKIGQGYLEMTGY